jgi:uncharacterized membrane protein
MRSKTDLQYPVKGYVILALGILSAICLKQVYDLQLASGRRPYMFIFWNMFLAWLPVVFMLGMDWMLLKPKGTFRKAAGLLFFLLWLGFYPNSSYMVTDLLHMFLNFRINPDQSFWLEMPFWNHLTALFLTGVTGLLLGAFTLMSIHDEVRRRMGRGAGWVFAVMILALSSFGVFMGRFVRWNTWDIWQNPEMIKSDLLHLLFDEWERSLAVAFCSRFFLLTLGVYVVLYLFSWLQAGRRS